MTNWMMRGFVFAAAMVVLRLFQGALINTWPTQAMSISVVLLILFVIGVTLWGLLDGRADARANPDPDRRADLAMTWLLTGLVAGGISGAVAWLISLLYKGLYVGALINELTTFAAFTALLVFLPGMGGVTVGRWAVDRQLEKQPVRHHGLAASDQDRTDTDVFDAVRADETPTGEVPVAQSAPTAYSEEPTQAAAAETGEEPTKPAHPPGDDQR
jgi:cbb3-type cytochrome oxidase subunit 3